MTYRVLLPVLLLALPRGIVCQTPSPVPQAPVASPWPCAADDTIYVPSDSVRGLRGPSPAYLDLTPARVNHRVVLWLLVDKLGDVVADSTEVLTSGGREDDEHARTIAAAMRFRPATRNGCTVRSRIRIEMSGR